MCRRCTREPRGSRSSYPDSWLAGDRRHRSRRGRRRRSTRLRVQVRLWKKACARAYRARMHHSISTLVENQAGRDLGRKSIRAGAASSDTGSPSRSLRRKRERAMRTRDPPDRGPWRRRLLDGERRRAADDYILALTRAAEPPRLLSADRLRRRRPLRRALLPALLGSAARPATSRCSVATRVGDGVEDDLASHLLGQDLIYVGGGNVVSMLGVWRAHGLDEVLREAWQRGIVLCGPSAGSLCWFAEALSAFHGPPRRVGGLGLLPYSNCVHYDAEPARRTEYHTLRGRRHARRVRRRRRSGASFQGDTSSSCGQLPRSTGGAFHVAPPCERPGERTALDVLIPWERGGPTKRGGARAKGGGQGPIATRQCHQDGRTHEPHRQPNQIATGRRTHEPPDRPNQIADRRSTHT